MAALLLSVLVCALTAGAERLQAVTYQPCGQQKCPGQPVPLQYVSTVCDCAQDKPHPDCICPARSENEVDDLLPILVGRKGRKRKGFGAPGVRGYAPHQIPPDPLPVLQGHECRPNIRGVGPGNCGRSTQNGLCDTPADAGCIGSQNIGSQNNSTIIPPPVNDTLAVPPAAVAPYGAAVPPTVAAPFAAVAPGVQAPAPGTVLPAPGVAPLLAPGLALAPPAAAGVPPAAPGALPAAPAPIAALAPEALHEAREATSHLIHALSDPSVAALPPLCGTTPETCKRLDCVIHPTCKAMLGI